MIKKTKKEKTSKKEMKQTTDDLCTCCGDEQHETIEEDDLE